MTPLAEARVVTRDQIPLFKEASLLPSGRPRIGELRPSSHLAAIFADCHNHIYANEGLLKDKIFQEIVKLLLMKLLDEQHAPDDEAEFSITEGEHRALLEGGRPAFLGRIETLFASVKSKFPELLRDGDALVLPPQTLAYVVARLQLVSLSKTPGDIKGEAFQAFIYRHQRGDRGEFFTPHPVVRLCVEMLQPAPDETVIDPACGSGGFLLGALTHVAGVSEKEGRRFDRTAYVRSRLRGIEFNPDIARAGMLRFAFEGGAGSEILCSNALEALPKDWAGFDVVLTNPPFGSKGKVENPATLEAYELGHKWEMASDGTWKRLPVQLAGQTPEVLFLERCIGLLAPGGRMAIVVPDGLLQNITNGYIRSWFRSKVKVLAVVSIPQEAFIPYGTGIKTSVLFLQKFPSSAPKRVFMAQVRRIGYDVKGAPVYQRTAKGAPVRDSEGRELIDEDIGAVVEGYGTFLRTRPTSVLDGDPIFSVPEQNLNSRLDVGHYLPSDLAIIEELRQGGALPLGQLADLVSEADDFRRMNTPIRYISISDVDARIMQVVAQETLSAAEAPSRATYRVQKGDIITAAAGASTGTHKHATALIGDEEDGAICSNGFDVIRNVRGVDPLFLLAYMRTKYFLRQVRRLLTGHAIPALTSSDLATVLVPVPPSSEQTRVAAGVKKLLSLRRQAHELGKDTVQQVESILQGAGPRKHTPRPKAR